MAEDKRDRRRKSRPISKELYIKYKRIVNDYNNGMPTSALTKKYKYTYKTINVIISQAKSQPRSMNRALIYIPEIIMDRYKEEAAKREITVGKFVSDFLCLVITDNLLDAILDEENND